MSNELDPLSRVIEERAELNARIDKLGAFKHTRVFVTLPWQEQERLNTQAHLMTAYSAILSARIAAFPVGARV